MQNAKADERKRLPAEELEQGIREIKALGFGGVLFLSCSFDFGGILD